MSDTAFRFNIGKFRCLVIKDGTITDQASEGRPVQVHNVNCLFIDNGKQRILIDAGCGEGFQSTAGGLLRNLEAEGIKPADIDRIIFTHGHLDHVGGAFNAAGAPIYPRARFLATRREWECWVNRLETSELQHMFFASARKNLLPVPELFDLVEVDAEILPGIKAIPAPGHTLGLIALEISSGRIKLLCIGDIIHSELEFAQPDYYALYDMAPGQAIETRNQVLSGAAKSGVLVFACHFAFPGLGHIGLKDGVFQWEPVLP
jgi:glyoxylase-like metal-dependent hydrolase (beta-lactamase superfamily II)